MSFHERLKKARRDLCLTQPHVSKLLREKGYDIKQYTISNWETGKRKPSVEEFAVLCELYEVNDPMILMIGKPAMIRPNLLLDGLNHKGRELAKKYIRSLKEDTLFTEGYKARESRSFRLYDLPFSAGTGMYLDSDKFQEITADDIVPESADYAVRVSGHSMEPKYTDGQILFVREQEALADGEIGIFSLNGDAFVKQLKHNTLVSLNPKYRPIIIREWDEFRVFGKVIGSG